VSPGADWREAPQSLHGAQGPDFRPYASFPGPRKWPVTEMGGRGRKPGREGLAGFEFQCPQARELGSVEQGGSHSARVRDEPRQCHPKPKRRAAPGPGGPPQCRFDSEPRVLHWHRLSRSGIRCVHRLRIRTRVRIRESAPWSHSEYDSCDHESSYNTTQIH
jgi:hypothetical protein